MIEDLDKWKKAGKIAAEILEYGKSLVKNGAVIREVCDKIDQKTLELGAKPAWPAQLSLDSTAAHFTPDFDFENNVVSLDLGAHVDGCIGDNALTVDLSGKFSDLVKASRAALDAAMKVLGPGVKVSEIGRTVQETIESFGFKPVRNLTGHGLSPWIIHDVPAIPNYDNKDETEIEAGEIIAIEPFATDGAGMVEELESSVIFSLENPKPVRNPFTRKIIAFIESNYKNLPFAKRWLVKEFGLGRTNIALNEMKRLEMLHSYPPLVDKNKGIVTQAEKTFLITENGFEILTK